MHLALSPTSEAPRQARRELSRLRGEIDGESLAYLRMVVSELVSLGVVNGAAGPIELSISVIDEHLDGTVEAGGVVARALERARVDEDDFLPLRIVDGLVDDWGTDPGYRRVWFQMAVQRLSGSGDDERLL
jgi:hypothetical protein